MYLPTHTGHRALAALQASPKTMSELRMVVAPTRPVTSLAKIAGYEADGLICRASKFSTWVLTDMGREALVMLNAGHEYTPVRAGVRIFVARDGEAVNSPSPVAR